MAHILVIDDEAQIREVLKTVLERVGHQVTEATDGLEGLKKYDMNGGNIDVVVVDIIMPEKGGIDTIMDLRRDFPDAKIIAITGGGELDGELDGEPVSVPYTKVALNSGADRSVGKPFVLDEFLEAIEELLHSKPAEPTTA